MRIAILIDGGFYRKQAKFLFGEKNPQMRADELIKYCMRHISENEGELYRIFYYDCKPSEKTIYNPLTNKSENLKKTDLYEWTNDFFAN